MRGVAVAGEVAVALAAGRQCWRCGAVDKELAVHGELVGDAGAVPLWVCRGCAGELEALYRAVVRR
ncbi:hypothetical protein [Streptomyces avicenniae]|uniref:hypothetical protein n=1 Tax=Streptomyces avicenniae TaxID=500153 RepID=UPI00069BA653|nr:hypothetical protein [Streptomyces avicenniae]